jgi:hypothetical protein
MVTIPAIKIYKNGDDWGMVQMDVYGIVLPTL